MWSTREGAIDTDSLENFTKAPLEKQQAVLNAGFVCFARDGYKKTAMSEIAAMAGVSKPSLFHYFGTKRDFYIYLFHFSCEAIGSEITAGSDDFFECFTLATEIKMRAIEKYSGMYEFLIAAVRESGELLFDLLRDANAQVVANGVKTLYANVNWAKLKDGVSPQDAISLVNWMSEGYLRENNHYSKDVIFAGIQRYLELIKTAIYREEFH
ncbi:TetR family transcriptional regulator [Clostridia bacterium]|nr:TetR family transcriptional regulator [Clostridia bacterium]